MSTQELKNVHKKNLLLIENDDTLRGMLKGFIEEVCHYKVFATDNKEEALQLLEAWPTDVVLMDYWVYSGPIAGIIPVAKEWWNSQVVVMTTMKAPTKLKEDLKVDYVIHKPFNIDELFFVLTEKNI